MMLFFTHNCNLSTSSLLFPKHILNHKVLYFSNKIFSPNCCTTLFQRKDAYFRWVWMPEIVFSQCSFQKSFRHHKLVYAVHWTCYDFFLACLPSLLLLIPYSVHCSCSWNSQQHRHWATINLPKKPYKAILISLYVFKYERLEPVFKKTSLCFEHMNIHIHRVKGHFFSSFFVPCS